jgi:hypothetical protein
MSEFSEQQACTAHPVSPEKLNPDCILPYGLSAQHIFLAMGDFIHFLSFVNQQLFTQGIQRLESFLMPANFSSIGGEFMNMTMPRYCNTLAKNRFHNGHPDLIPVGLFPNNAVQYSAEGIEVKASRRATGWQGHNPESVWLIVFQFSANSASELASTPQPFRFNGVYAAKLEKEDWSFSGRAAASRRTITASVTHTGLLKMKANWVYRDLPGKSAS